MLPLVGFFAACDSSGDADAGPADPPRPAATAPVPETAPPTFVTSAACRECHAEAYAAWQGSHHDRAMQPATAEHVLAVFDGNRVEVGGASWRFERRGDRFVVHTVGEDGSPAEFPVLYTFGVEPLQQFLVELPGGRLQALTMAWDSRPREDGGQRWFSLIADDEAPPGDVMHWTGAANRWNTMCAECHSTQLERNFDLETRRYATRWAELNVACESCHGPGSEHLRWAQSEERVVLPHSGLLPLGGSGEGRWVMNEARGIAAREPPLAEHRQLEVCAPCHSRRRAIAPAKPGDRFLDGYQPALLDEGLYRADGTILGEVYVYGSFVQSKMHTRRRSVQ